VGSAFKLYVLGAMLAEHVEWSRVFYLKEAHGALPGGSLRGWPGGSPLTAHTLAALMISENDNTAADLLIDSIGRRNIEGDLQKLGHSNPGLMRPLLKSSEMSRLKGDTGAALGYLNLPLADKYLFLAKSALKPLNAAALKTSPLGTDKVEWHASPADLCRLMEYVQGKGDKRALEILAITPPPASNPGTEAGGGVNLGPGTGPGRFSYVGYKGGSGPGLLSMTWLLKGGGNVWYCLSASWNGEKADSEETKFAELLQSVLRADWD
jgi:hypothetical protein